MDIDPDHLPDDAAALQQMVLGLLHELEDKDRRLIRVRHLLEQLLRWRYGQKRGWTRISCSCLPQSVVPVCRPAGGRACQISEVRAACCASMHRSGNDSSSWFCGMGADAPKDIPQVGERIDTEPLQGREVLQFLSDCRLQRRHVAGSS
jgi:hypothetical protein